MQQGDSQLNFPVKCPKDLTKKVFVKDKQNCRLLFTLGKAGEAVSNKSRNFRLDNLKNRKK